MYRAQSSKQKKRPLGFYEKALPPPNPRYAHVASRIDSGPTVAKLRVVTTRQFVKRKAEAFARVTPGQLAALAAEYADEIGGGGGGVIWEEEEDGEAGGDGSAVVVTYEPTREAPAYERPYLLLDVRTEPGAFERTRLVEARHLPPHLLRQDRLPPEMLRFRNREGTLLILYDQNDGAPAEAGGMATELVLRGWENVYVLSGGYDAVAAELPYLVEGLPPSSSSPSSLPPHHHNSKEHDDPLRLSEANLARLSLAATDGARKGPVPAASSSASARGGSVGGGSRGASVVKGRGGGGGRAASSVVSAVGSVTGRKRLGGGGRAAPSVVTAGTGLSVAETVIARAQARKGMF